MEQRNPVKVIAAVAIVVVVLLVAVLAQVRGGSQQAGASASPSTSASGDAVAPQASPSPVDEASASATASDQAALEAFLRDELPRRIEGDPMAKGAVDAPVVLTKWSDYRCPYCSLWVEEVEPELQALIDDGTLRIEVRDLVLFGDESTKAATAARAAGRQGKYFEFQAALFAALPNEGHPDVPDELVNQIVAELGLDAAQFAADWADPALAQEVTADTAQALEFGIDATPAFVVGSQYVRGYVDAATLVQLIESQR